MGVSRQADTLSASRRFADDHSRYSPITFDLTETVSFNFVGPAPLLGPASRPVAARSAALGRRDFLLRDQMAVGRLGNLPHGVEVRTVR